MKTIMIIGGCTIVIKKMKQEQSIHNSIQNHPNVPYIGAKLWDKQTGANATYSIPILDEVECISPETIFNNIGNRIEKLVLEQDKIKPYAVFKIKGYKRKCIVGRMDFLESVLKRGGRGMRVETIEKNG